MPRIPTYHATADIHVPVSQGGGIASPNALVELYESSVTRLGEGEAEGYSGLWTMLFAGINPANTGYNPLTGVWNPADAMWIGNVSWDAYGTEWVVRGWGVRWAGQPAQHSRWYLLHMFPQRVSNLPHGTSIPVGSGGIPGLADVYRPFGAAAPVAVNQQCVFYAYEYPGRGSYSGGNYFRYDTVFVFASLLDIRDGVARSAGLDVLSFSDGDEVRFPNSGGSTRYVVVKVERYSGPDGLVYKRVYTLRDQAHWPGP